MSEDPHPESAAPLLVPQSTAGLANIEAICQRFETAWRQGTSPVVEQFLELVPESDRPLLLEELVRLDLHYRLQSGDTVNLHDYRQRFPQFESRLNNISFSNAPGTVDFLGVEPEKATPAGTGQGDKREHSVRWPIVPGYEIRGELGRGGMGEVFWAHDASLDRVLAVKVLQERHRHNATLQRRFVEEAQIMGQLQHPGVAPIHELGRLDDGRPFFSMKQINGKTLASLLRRQGAVEGGSESEQQANDTASGGLARPVAGGNAKDTASTMTTQGATEQDELPRLLAIFEQVCQTLAYAHSHRIIHRDLKPSNIMVGAFGEVQVMDWGLAKRIAARPTGHETEETVNAAAADTDSFRAPTEETAAGTVLGTVSYMAPEQARGEIAQLDERCDVFGLGAILCEILTANAPFVGPDANDRYRLAARGDLRDAFARLDACPADVAIVVLAKKCLASAKADRPRDAGEVAKAMARNQSRARQRLWQAVLDRESAQVKAAEASKRRRNFGATLASVLTLLALALTGVGLRYYFDWVAQSVEAAHKETLKQKIEKALADEINALKKQRLDLQAKLGDPLTAAQLMSDIGAWCAAIDKLRHGHKKSNLLASANKDMVDQHWLTELASLEAEITAAADDWTNAKALDDVSRTASSTIEGKVNAAAVADEYALRFREMNLDVTDFKKINTLAKSIAQSSLRYVLVAALDQWSVAVLLQKKSPHYLLNIARMADPDPWRDSVRRDGDSLPTLQSIAAEAKPQKQPPHVLIALALRLNAAGGQANAEALLRQSVFHHPRDFWLHFHLAKLLPHPGEKAVCLQAALLLRPDSSLASFELGRLRLHGKDLEAAHAAFLKAIEIDDRYMQAHAELSLVLFLKKDSTAAMKHSQKVLELAPAMAAHTYNDMGVFLRDNNQVEWAVKHFEEAVRLDSKFSWPHRNLGWICYSNREFDSAVKHFGNAFEADPKYADAYYGLGLSLFAKKDNDGAAIHLKKAISLDANQAHVHYHLGSALRAKKDLKGAVASYEKALELSPKFSEAHNNLGLVLWQMNELDGAIRCFKKVLEIQPKHSLAGVNLLSVQSQKALFGNDKKPAPKAPPSDPSSLPPKS